ncbi:MAG: hypothetical protein EOP53_10705, partial [Sphingobacteriales bacterium]
FKNFEHNINDSTSLPENDLEDIAIDADNNIWLSYRTGICMYNQATHRFTIIKHNNKSLPASSIVFDKKRNCIWAVNAKSYIKINTKTPDPIVTDFIHSETGYSEIYPLLLDSKDRLWIPYGRARYHCITLSSGSQYFYNKKECSPTSVYEDEEHNIWMTTWQRGFRKIIVDDTGHNHIRYEDPFLKIAEDKYDYISQAVTQSKALTGNNILWIAKNTDGILLFDKKQNKFIQQFLHDGNDKNGLATNFNENIYCDPTGIIWICSWHGLTKVNKQEQQFVSKEIPWLNSQLYNCVNGMVADPYEKDVAWMSVGGSGLFKINKNSGEVIDRHFYYYSGNSFTGSDLNYDWRWLNGLTADTENNIWGLTYGGLIKVQKGRVIKIPVYRNDGEYAYPIAITQSEKGFIWAASGRGMARINTNNNSYTFFQDTSITKGSGGLLGDLEQLDKDNLIMGVHNGLRIFNTVTGKFTRLNLPALSKDTINEKAVMALQKIDNKLYIGTFAGVKVYDLQSKQQYFIGKELGINKIDINRLKKDANNNLWIFTSGGLFKYDTNKNTFEKFTTSDGIYNLSEDAIGFFDYNNRFYIGYRMALTHFDPLQVNINTVKVNPVITEVLINGTLLNEAVETFQNNSLQLSHQQNEIIFSYTAPDYTNADKITFQYQLEGYDKEWINAGTRHRATYNNLLPGHYTFKLKAINSSNLPNEKITTFKIYIKAPFWKTWWFNTLSVTLLVAIGYLVYRYRLAQIKKIYEVRSSISRSLHDEVGATLSSINIYSDVARNKTSEPAVQQLIDKVYQASANAMESMSDIVWYVNPKNDLLENLLIRMREYALPLLEAKGINVSFEARENLEELKTTMQQRHHLYLIFKEAVNNALKYADAKNISISIVRESSRLKMQIKDDGKGFVSNNQFSGNGIKNMHSRAADINATLAITSVPQHGTLITLQLTIT